MGAICGILHFDGAPVAERDLGRILDTMPHRMPDGRRIWCGGAIGLGHGLLRVTAEDGFEAQPLHDRDSDSVLVADLRLDNRDELARTLGIASARLGDLPDSALLMAAWRRWGTDCARHLLGDFIFAIWDGRERRLVLGRDHMGQRHVHYHRGADFFIFATEIKGLWTRPDVPRRLSEASIGRMLIHDMSPHVGRTPHDGILGVPGATVMTVSADGVVRQEAYWEPAADPAHLGRSEAYYVEAYRAVLGEAVACRLSRAARTPGLIFSGGYDSAAIAGLAGSALAPTGRKLVAVAATMPADYQGTIRHAGRWVEMCARDMPHLDLHRVTREGRDPLQGFEAGCHRRDGPAGNYHFVQDEIMERLAAKGARLVMDGHGGDYTLNPRGQAALARFLKTGQLRRFAAEFRPHLRMSNHHSLWRTLKDDLLLMLLPPGWLTRLRRIKHGPRPVWGDQPIAPDFARRLIADGSIDPARLRVAARAQTEMRAQILTVLQRVVSAAAAGGETEAAAYGLALTRPFHDKRVVELALAIPEDLYVKNGRNRHLACAALKDVYPPEFQARWRRNDDQIPDFQRIVKRVEPQILAEIARMEASDKLARHIDFAKIRRLLAARGAEDHNSGWEQETQLALGGFLTARYIRWFEGHND